MKQQPQVLHRDGTSQAGRIQKALDPEYIRVDERSIKDLLKFAREYSKELRYFNEDNVAQGEWSDFLSDNDLGVIAAYINDPEKKKIDESIKPHLVLFVTFLELLQHAHNQLNELTRRHLEFYYREALRLTSQQGVPDHIHVLVDLANGQDQFLVPAGTLFQAGRDSQGHDLFYRSDEDLVANQAAVASVKSLFAAKQVIGIREARQDPDALIKMLVMALGTPGSGGKLEPYPGNRIVNEDFLKELDTLLKFIPDSLYMSISTFRSLMELKNGLLVVKDQEKLINQQWKQINDILEKAGKRRDAQFNLDRLVPDKFEGNLLSALKLSKTELVNLFKELPDVDDIYDLYRNRVREDVKAFVKASLYMSVDDFENMMGIVEEINGRWRQIYEILRAAGKKKDPMHEFNAPEIRTYKPNSKKFNDLIRKTLGDDIEYPVLGRQLESFDECYFEINNLVDYFHMPAEKFVLILGINAKQEVQPWEWEQVYVILEDAHIEKTLMDRRNALKGIKESGGFDALILSALGDPSDKFLKLDSEHDGEYIQRSLFLTAKNFNYVKSNFNIKAKDPKWENVYAILEQAQRRKRKWEVPRAEIEKWENVYAAEDARQVQVGAGGESDSPRWRTFGEGHHPQADGQVRTAPGDIGFAIASPLLLLAEGTRTITLTLDFHKEGFDAVANTINTSVPFRFLLSTEKEMVPINRDETENAYDPAKPNQLKFKLKLDAQVPPITPLKTGKGIQTPWSLLQIMLADTQEQENVPKVKIYRTFQSLKLKKITLDVNVAGITDLVLQNDEGMLNPKTPFTPFGGLPVVGSSFYFAHPELCSKKLSELRLNIDWIGAPEKFNTHYSGYLNSDGTTSVITANNNFNIQLALYDNRSFSIIKKDVDKSKPFPLFDTSDARKKASIIIEANEFSKNFPNYKPDIQPIIAPIVVEWRRYWQLELLDPDFLHAVYPQAAAANAPVIIKPPYTPKIKKMSAGYTASLEINLTVDRSTTEVDQIYHIEPFGYRNLTGDKLAAYPFLPQYENEGELFIGIKNLVPPQNLSLLFQMAEGSADPDVEREVIHWSYLDANEWKTLEKGQLLGDSTNGLLNSGIIKFSLTPVEASTLLPAYLYWIRAVITKNSRSVSDTVAILAQAVSATFEAHGNAADHLSKPLPAESIRGLAEALPQVKAIHQPYSSYGGKSPEQAGKFYTRVSERLRHKDRALTSWDYEHMVLEAFPGIYKVKCLPVGSSEDPGLSDVVQVVVIPDIRGKQPFDPFEPKASAELLWQIEQYLLTHSPPYCQLKVKNPTYVRIRIRLGVRFREGYNPGYYQDALNKELQQYLSPWAYDQSADIFFGGEINTSLIVNFVEERPYIDYVAGIKLFTSLDGNKFDPYDPETTVPGAVFAPDTVLVSDRSHVIDQITEETFEEEFFTGINYMKIELDFQVG